MGMSEFHGATDEAESIAAIHRALDLGVTFLDTADVSCGRSGRRPLPRHVDRQPLAASWPHAAAMSRPRVSRTVAGMRARSSTCLNASIAFRDEPSYIPVGL